MLTVLSPHHTTIADQALRDHILSLIYCLGARRNELVNDFVVEVSERYATDLVNVIRFTDGIPLRGCLILLQSLLFTPLVNAADIFRILKSILHKEAFAFGVLYETFALILPDDHLREELIKSEIIPHLLNHFSTRYVYESLALGMIDVTKGCISNERLHSFVDYLMESGLVSFLISQNLILIDVELTKLIDNLFKQLIGFRPHYLDAFFKSVNLREDYLELLNYISLGLPLKVP